MYQSPRLPRVVLTPNLQHSREDPPNPDARESDNYESEKRQHRGTCSGNIDFRIPGIPHSTVEQVDTNRRETVKRLIEQFENHPHRNVLLKDFEKAEEINHFSEESKNLITDMGNTEIFELHETSLKRQCPDCALYWEIGIVYCTCGECMQPTEHFNKKRFDVLSIHGYVTKKDQSRGARHGQSMRQVMYHKARDMLRKAKTKKNGCCKNYS